MTVVHAIGGAGDESESDSEELGGSKVTLAYQSKRTSEREGLQDMGATLTLETESTTKVHEIILVESMLNYWYISPIPCVGID